MVLLLVGSVFTPHSAELVAGADATDQPDLEVTNIDIQPASPDSGEDVEFCIEVRNSGDRTVDTVEVEATVNGELAAVPPTTTLGPGETDTLPCTGTDEFDPGTYTVTGTVDPDDHIDESNERNNDYSTEFQVDGDYGTIKGHVQTDHGGPVEAARVYLDNGDAQTVTDSEGYYIFDEVPAGSHSIDIAAAKYEDPSPKSVHISDDDTKRVDFSLQVPEHTIELSSEPIHVETIGEGSYTHGTDVRISAPTSDGGYEFQAWKTHDGEIVSEDAEFTLDYINHDYDIVAHYRKPGKPDLVVDGISWTPLNPDEGSSVKFNAEVENQGESRAADIDIELTVGSHVYRKTNFDLAPGESGDITFGPWDAEASAEEVDVTIDYSDRIEEKNEDNNERSASISVADTKPDLKIYNVNPSPSRPEAGDQVNFDITIKNAGDADADSFGVQVNAEGDRFSKTDLDLDDGQTKTVTLGTWDAKADVDSVTATVDYRDSVDENDESNNEEKISLEVSEQEKIAAEVEDVDPAAGSYTAGEDASTETTIRNTGNRRHEFYVGYSVRGPDGKWRDNDGSTHESVWLDPGETETVTVDWEVEDEAPTGEYDVWITVYRDEQYGDLEDRIDGERRGDEFSVTTENSPPNLRADRPNDRTTVSTGEEVDFKVDVDDPDGNLQGVDWYVGGESEGKSWINGGNETARWTTAFDSAGTYRVEAQAHDDEGEYSDPVSWTVEVEDPKRIRARPDLQVSDVDWRPDNPSAGEDIEFRLTVRNTGEAQAETVEMEVQMDGKIAVVYPTTTLDPGETYTTPWSGSYEISAETHEVRGTIDPDDHKDESNEGNNWYTETVSVQASTGTIEGRITTTEGEPINGAAVSLRGGGETRTDEDGYYQLTEVATGQHTLEVETVKYGSKQSSVTVGQDETTTQDFEFQPNRPDLQVENIQWGPEHPQTGDELTFTTTIENTGDAQADGVEIQLSVRGHEFTREISRLDAHSSRTIQIAESWTAEQGQHTARVEVDPDNRVEEQSEDNNQETATVSVGQATGTLRGTVIDSDDQPISDATVRLENGETITTGGNGEFTFETIPIGTYEITITKEGYTSYNDEITVVGGETGTLRATLESTASGSITFDGFPDTYEKNKWYTVTVTVRNTGNAAQTFTVETLEPSGTDIDESTTREVRVDEGETETAEYRVQFYGTDTQRGFTAKLYSESGKVLDRQSIESQPLKTGSLTVEVMSQDGSHLSGATVYLENHVQREQETNSEGRAIFERLPAGTYLIYVTTDFRTQIWRISVGAGRNSETFEVVQGAVFGGTVVTENGEPVENAKVLAGGRSTRTSSNGAFEFEDHFAPASYPVEIKVDGKEYTRAVELHGSTSQTRKFRIPDPDQPDAQGIRLQDLTAIINGEELSREQKERYRQLAEEMTVEERGWFFGEYGTKYPNVVEGAENPRYFAGWLGGSVTTGVELLADKRDCNVKTGHGVVDQIDCAGYTINVAGYAITGIGLAVAATGYGALPGGAIAGGGQKIQSIEETTDIATITTRWVKFSDKASETARILSEKFSTATVRRIISNIDDSQIARRLRKYIPSSIDFGQVSRFSRYDINVEVRTIEDGKQFVRELGGEVSNGRLRGISKGELGEKASQALLKRKGHQVAEGFSKTGARQQGIDLVTREGDQFVIAESKFTSSTGNIGKGLLSRSSAGRQMSDAWIRDAIQRMVDQGTMSQELADRLTTAMRRGNLRKKVVVVKNSDEAGTITKSLNDISIDSVDIIHIGEVVE